MKCWYEKQILDSCVVVTRYEQIFCSESFLQPELCLQIVSDRLIIQRQSGDM